MIDKLTQNLDKNILKIMITGLKFCLVLAIISIFLLLTYKMFLPIPQLYHIGYLLLKNSIFFTVFFIIFSISFNGIIKEK